MVLASSYSPTPQQEDWVGQTTCSMYLSLDAPPGWGTWATDHSLPFQWSIWLANVTVTVSWMDKLPGAQQFEADVQVTLSSMFWSSLLVPCGCGVLTRLHFFPFHRSAWFSTAPFGIV